MYFSNLFDLKSRDVLHKTRNIFLVQKLLLNVDNEKLKMMKTYALCSGNI